MFQNSYSHLEEGIWLLGLLLLKLYIPYIAFE